jgi:hypothetical protein
MAVTTSVTLDPVAKIFRAAWSQNGVQINLPLIQTLA